MPPMSIAPMSGPGPMFIEPIPCAPAVGAAAAPVAPLSAALAEPGVNGNVSATKAMRTAATTDGDRRFILRFLPPDKIRRLRANGKGLRGLLREWLVAGA